MMSDEYGTEITGCGTQIDEPSSLFSIHHSAFIIPFHDIHSNFSGVFRASKIVCMAGCI